MSDFICEKTENCFSNSQTYLYILGLPIDDAFLDDMSELGELEIKRNFRRPFFFLRLTDGSEIRGMLRDDCFKASFPDNNDITAAKTGFEAALRRILERWE